MSEIEAVYEKLRSNEMNDWVGGGDPKVVGQLCYHHLRRVIPVMKDMRVLDYGCGIGRTILAALEHDPAQQITGIDIMVPAVEFCQQEIASRFPSTNFELLNEANEHYDSRAGQRVAALSREEIVAKYADSFDVAYAFSVFTHIAPEDFVGLLKFIRQILKPGGTFLLTGFLLTPWTRARIAADACKFKFERPEFREDGQVFVGDAADPLAFIAYDYSRMQQMAFDAGLFIFNIESGGWSGGDLGWSLQDLIVVRRPFEGR